MPQLVADRCDEVALRLVLVDFYPQHPVRASRCNPHEARRHVVPALAHFDIDNAVAGADRLNQASKRYGLLRCPNNQSGQ